MSLYMDLECGHSGIVGQKCETCRATAKEEELTALRQEIERLKKERDELRRDINGRIVDALKKARKVFEESDHRNATYAAIDAIVATQESAWAVERESEELKTKLFASETHRAALVEALKDAVSRQGRDSKGYPDYYVENWETALASQPPNEVAAVLEDVLAELVSLSKCWSIDSRPIASLRKLLGREGK